jgi:hypothetical protein
MDGSQGIQPIITLLLLKKLIDEGGSSASLDKDTLLLLLVAGAGGQNQMAQSGTPGGWDMSNPLMLLVLLKLLKRDGD